MPNFEAAYADQVALAVSPAPELATTTRPRAARSAGRHARVSSIGATRFTSICARSEAGSSAATGSSSTTPAMWCSESSRSGRPESAASESGSARSATIVCAPGNAADSSAARDALRASSHSSSPRSCRARATAAPMPEPAPVIRCVGHRVKTILPNC